MDAILLPAVPLQMSVSLVCPSAACSSSPSRSWPSHSSCRERRSMRRRRWGLAATWFEYRIGKCLWCFNVNTWCVQGTRQFREKQNLSVKPFLLLQSDMFGRNTKISRHSVLWWFWPPPPPPTKICNKYANWMNIQTDGWREGNVQGQSDVCVQLCMCVHRREIHRLQLWSEPNHMYFSLFVSLYRTFVASLGFSFPVIFFSDKCMNTLCSVNCDPDPVSTWEGNAGWPQHRDHGLNPVKPSIT